MERKSFSAFLIQIFASICRPVAMVSLTVLGVRMNLHVQSVAFMNLNADPANVFDLSGDVTRRMIVEMEVMSLTAQTTQQHIHRSSSAVMICSAVATIPALSGATFVMESPIVTVETMNQLFAKQLAINIHVLKSVLLPPVVQYARVM